MIFLVRDIPGASELSLSDRACRLMARRQRRDGPGVPRDGIDRSVLRRVVYLAGGRRLGTALGCAAVDRLDRVDRWQSDTQPRRGGARRTGPRAHPKSRMGGWP